MKLKVIRSGHDMEMLLDGELFYMGSRLKPLEALREIRTRFPHLDVPTAAELWNNAEKETL